MSSNPQTRKWCKKLRVAPHKEQNMASLRMKSKKNNMKNNRVKKHKSELESEVNTPTENVDVSKEDASKKSKLLWEKPKKMSKRQQRVEEAISKEPRRQEKIDRLNSPKEKSRKKRSPRSSKKVLSKHFKGPCGPEEGKKLGKSGNISYGGHGEEWKNTSFANRLGNNHMLRVKREQAARLKQLEAQNAPSSLLSGKAKKAFLKEKRVKKREKKEKREQEEKLEQEEKQKNAKIAAAAANLEFQKLQKEKEKKEQEKQVLNVVDGNTCTYKEEAEFLEHAFQNADQDNSGYLSIDSLRNVMLHFRDDNDVDKLVAKEIDTLIDEFNFKNGILSTIPAGQIQYKEFLKMITTTM